MPQATEPGGVGRATLIPVVVPGGTKWECLSIWSCSEWGLPSFPCHHGNWCALTAPFHPYQGITSGAVAARSSCGHRSHRACGPGGLFSVALSLGSPPLDVIQHPALWSPDFPPLARWRRAITSSPSSCHFRQANITSGGNVGRYTAAFAGEFLRRVAAVT